MVLRLTELGWVPGRPAFGRRIDLGFRQYASRKIDQFGIWCIEVPLVFVGRSTSLLLCLLDGSKRRLARWVLYRRSKKSEISDGLLPPRNESLRLQFFPQLSVGSRRTAVGLAPLGRTNNGW